MENEKEYREVRKVTLVGFFINLVLSAGKLAAGIAGRSSAMVADAIHSISDFATDIVVLLFVKLSGRPADHTHRYGHGKYETIAGVIIGMALLGVGVGICVSGIGKIVAAINGEVIAQPHLIALIAAAVSIIVKEWLYRYTVRTGKKLKSQAVIANAWHHRSDAFSSIGALLGIGGAYFLGAKWAILDPITAVAVSLFIIKVSIDIVRPGIDELLEKSLSEEEQRRIMAIIVEHGEVSDPHNLYTRRIGTRVAIEVHIRFDSKMPVEHAHTITTDIEMALKNEFGTNTHITIHMEPQK